MARKAKVDNHLKKRLERQERKRKENFRSIRQYYLIVCEGEKTEPLYLTYILFYVLYPILIKSNDSRFGTQRLDNGG